MRDALLLIGTFTTALVGTTVWSLVRTPLAEPPVGLVALASSISADSLRRDSVIEHTGEPSNARPIVDANSLALSAFDVGGQATGDESHPPTAPDSSNFNTAYQSLARIFARMKPVEAAEVLQHMSNREVEGIVRNLSVRHAAAVLASLPERRAAELAKLLLMPAPGSSR